MKQLIRSFIVLTLFCGTTIASAQPAFKTALSPIPIWPSDEVIPVELEDKYVFLDPGAGQVVLAYSEPGINGGAESRKIQRVDLKNQVQASVTVSVEKNSGEFTYKYHVANAENAPRPVSSIKLVTPSELQYEEAKTPVSWEGDIDLGYVAASSIGIGKTIGTLMNWSTSAGGIEPGKDEVGFELVSSLKPGFTWGYAQSDAPQFLPSDLPEEVLAQVKPMLKIENNSQSFLTIGPKFYERTPLLRIVAEYHFGISSLIGKGELSEKSPAIEEALNVMEQYMESARQAGDVELDEWIGPDLAFHVEPANGLEKDVIEALKLSLN